MILAQGTKNPIQKLTVCSTVCSDHINTKTSPASSMHSSPYTQKAFPWYDVIMWRNTMATMQMKHWYYHPKMPSFIFNVSWFSSAEWDLSNVKWEIYLFIKRMNSQNSRHLATQVFWGEHIATEVIFAKTLSAYFLGHTVAYLYLRKKLRMLERLPKK